MQPLPVLDPNQPVAVPAVAGGGAGSRTGDGLGQPPAESVVAVMGNTVGGAHRDQPVQAVVGEVAGGTVGSDGLHPVAPEIVAIDVAGVMIDPVQRPLADLGDANGPGEALGQLFTYIHYSYPLYR